MDCRVTLGKDETFAAMLRTCMHAKEKVAMLLDEDGLTRAEGYIRCLELDAPQPYIELEDDRKISCGSIVAINGIFLDAYSGC